MAAQDHPNAMAPQPNIVLVHGAWADGSSWTAVIERLQAAGHRVTAPQFAMGLIDRAYSQCGVGAARTSWARYPRLRKIGRRPCAALTPRWPREGLGRATLRERRLESRNELGVGVPAR